MSDEENNVPLSWRLSYFMRAFTVPRYHFERMLYSDSESESDDSGTGKFCFLSATAAAITYLSV